MAHASTPLWVCDGYTIYSYLMQHYPSAVDAERTNFERPNLLPGLLFSICEDMTFGAEEGCTKTLASAAADVYAYVQERYPKHLEAVSVVTGLPRQGIPAWTGRPFNAAGDWDYVTNPEYRGKPVTPDDVRQAIRLLEGHAPAEVAE
jgi:hypothetical protein